MAETILDFKEQIATARRTQILMGAAQVFSKKGFHRATTKEIARAAEVSEGTLYNYFDNKRALLVAIMELLGARSLEEIIRPSPATDPRQFLTETLYDFYALFQARGHFAAPILAEIFADQALHRILYRQMVQPIARYIDEQLHPPPYPGKLRLAEASIDTYALIGAVMLNFILKATNLDPDYEQLAVEALIERLVDMALVGLGVDDELVWLMG
jgi:AcrR family transcriptional regulator